ncbi:hypothetical protein LSAT2_030431 [Lamellibrachia satsuma]|nr:hypothetical protein LSAT2_030431 [Lamellibrachia satsuma]
MTALQTLSLSGCQLSGAGTKALANALHHLPQLIDLRLDGNRLDDPTTVQVLADNVLKMTTLQTLSLKGCKLSGAGAYTLAAALQHLPLLTKLKLDSNTFDDSSTGVALAGNVSKMTALETLGLNGCKLSGASTKALAIALHQLPQLRKARLDSNLFGDPSTGQALVDAISKMTALQELSLNGCKLSGTEVNTLAVALCHLPELIQLSLDSNQFIDPTTGQDLANSLSKMTALQHLSLNGCKLSGAGAEAVAVALHQLPQLTKLKLDSNRFDNPITIGSLAASVSKMTALQQLSLNGCQLSGAGTKALADALHHLPQLTQLMFDNNNLSDPTTGQTLVDSVSKMTSLRTLRYDENV